LNTTANVRTYVTLRRFRATVVQWKYITYYYILWVCDCSLRYPTCNEHALYFHLWPLQFYKTFPTTSKNGTIFEKQVTEYKICVLTYLQNFPYAFLIIMNEMTEILS
jgi:hypothetical protein